MNFSELNIIEPILKALEEEWYSTPTPIQEQSIPLILQRKDILGCAQTWTWKTASFAIPILQMIHNKNRSAKHRRIIKALVLAPTRELAIQIWESFTTYGRHLALRNTIIYGWVGQWTQVKELKKWVDILIATPWRLLDLIIQNFVDLKSLDFFVLDEADRMLDMWFINDIKSIMSYISPIRQNLLFSATMPSSIIKLAEQILVNPKKIEVTPASSTVDTISQSVYFVDKSHKNELLLHILKDKKISSVLVFSKTKYWADKIVNFLNNAGIKSCAIHWDKKQWTRQAALRDFKNWNIKVLVATDIAARWIDIDDLSFVINYDLPSESETYVHRIWRTWRAWSNWNAISFCDNEEKNYLWNIIKLIKKDIPVVLEHPFAI